MNAALSARESYCRLHKEKMRGCLLLDPKKYERLLDDEGFGERID